MAQSTEEWLARGVRSEQQQGVSWQLGSVLLRKRKLDELGSAEELLACAEPATDSGAVGGGQKGKRKERRQLHIRLPSAEAEAPGQRCTSAPDRPVASIGKRASAIAVAVGHLLELKESCARCRACANRRWDQTVML